EANGGLRPRAVGDSPERVRVPCGGGLNVTGESVTADRQSASAAFARAPAISRAETLWLVAILAVAAVLRPTKLDSSLWYDEVDTLVNFVRAPFAELVTNYPSLNHHVLFSLEAKVSTLLFGESAWALRLPAALLGVGSIWAAWLLAREVLSRNE